METLRRISGKFSRRQESAPASSAPHADQQANEMPSSMLTVDVRPQAAPEPAAAQAEEAPRSPLTGKPLSPRAQMMRAQLASELEQGPVIF